MASTLNASNSGAGGLISTADASGVLQLQSAGTTAVTIDTSQNVGIGTASPAGKLDVNGTIYGGKNGTSRGYVSIQSSGDTAHTGYIEFLAPNGTRQGYLGYADVSGSGQFNLWGESSTNALAFATNSTERMRIDSSGNMLIGTTTSGTANTTGVAIVGTANSGVGLVNVGHPTGTGSGAFYCGWSYNGTTIGAIVQSGTAAVTYNTTSDYRLKENITPITGALDKVAQLKPVTYTWKNTDNEIGEGFIAHELAEVCPLAVNGKKDDVNEDGSIKPQGIDTSVLVATLTAAIQEMKAIIDEQSVTINDLKARIETLEAK